MTCNLNGLFSIGDDFDDEDLFEAEWAAPAVPACVSAPVPSSALGARTPGGQDNTSSHRTLKALNKDTSGPTQTAATDTVRPGLRQISSVPEPSSSSAQHACPAVAPQLRRPGPQKASDVRDEFEDWDVDLADLDESVHQAGPGVQNQKTLAPPTAGELVSSVIRLRPPNHGRTHPESRTPYRGSGGVSPSPRRPPHCVPSASPGPRPSLGPAPPWIPVVFNVPSSPSPRATRGSHHPPSQRPWTTPGGGPAPPPMYSPRPLSTPVLTNHLVRLVSAANNPPRKRSRSGAQPASARRFPGPAGLLPQQSLNQSLDDIVVSVPQTPAHGAVARLPSQSSGSQSEEEEFTSGPWGAMKADMGLDERNATCFLHSYSVVMVLRKAALRQLAQNKVPNMAVQLKSIVHTHADAKAVFRDPTGEIAGTVHRRLLEDRLGELKAGAVLLLKQVGVFSPSHRNHYLNVTPSNLLKIYPPDGEASSSTSSSTSFSSSSVTPCLPPLMQEPACPSTSAPWGPVSSMQLELEDDDDDEDEDDEEVRQRGDAPGTRSEEVPPGSELQGGPQDPAWDGGGDDDLNELLGDLLEDRSSL
ncbi:unnamed protein product [Arctogadus glacialis]